MNVDCLDDLEADELRDTAQVVTGVEVQSPSGTSKKRVLSRTFVVSPPVDLSAVKNVYRTGSPPLTGVLPALRVRPAPRFTLGAMIFLWRLAGRRSRSHRVITGLE